MRFISILLPYSQTGEKKSVPNRVIPKRKIAGFYCPWLPSFCHARAGGGRGLQGGLEVVGTYGETHINLETFLVGLNGSESAPSFEETHFRRRPTKRKHRARVAPRMKEGFPR